jgi:MoxR-like ATPase
VGKTLLAKSLARSIDGRFQRLQCTPDLLPSDITGTNMWNPKSGEFEYLPGPVFANILLADEINRATPRTQSALLEVMEEQQVTVDGVSRKVPAHFCDCYPEPHRVSWYISLTRSADGSL